MKFYDLEWLAKKCGTDNKYEITAKVAAEARRESEEALPAKDKDSPADERFISNVLLEIEEDKSPISVDYKPVENPERPERPERPGRPQRFTPKAAPAPEQVFEDAPKKEKAEKAEKKETEENG